MRRILVLLMCLSLTSFGFAAMSVDNYFNHPQGTSSTDNILTIGGTQNVISGGTLAIASGATFTMAGIMTYTAQPTFSAGFLATEDIAITLDASDEEWILTTSSGGVTAAVTIRNTTADLAVDQHLLSLDLTDNADANGIFLRCRDNTYANTVMQVGADGAITIDASGAGSGTVISENTIVVNDAAMDVDTETQPWNFGDGTNDFIVSDNGEVTWSGTGNMTFLDGSDLLVTANSNASPFVSASESDTMLGSLTMGTADADGGVLSIIKGTTGSDPTFSITQGATAVTLDETVGDLDLTAADDMTFTATGDNISFVTADADISGDLAVTGGDITIGASESISYTAYTLQVSTSVDVNTQTLLNIGNAGTDFSNVGGLTLADDLTVTGNNINDSGGTGITFDGSGSMSVATNITAVGDLVATGNDLTLGASEKLTYGSYKITVSTQVLVEDIEMQNGLFMRNDAAGQWNIDDAGGNSLLQVTDAGTTGNVDVSGTLNASGASTLIETTIAGTGLTLNSFSVLTDSDTLTVSSNTINVCTKAGAMEVDLPDAATSDGKIFTFKKTDSDASIIALDANGGTIDGADPYNEIDAQYDFVTIISDGTNWHIIAKYITP